jgi:hypothetical protein
MSSAPRERYAVVLIDRFLDERASVTRLVPPWVFITWATTGWVGGRSPRWHVPEQNSSQPCWAYEYRPLRGSGSVPGSSL